MSEPATPARPFYVTGGTLKPGEPSYVERRADAELYESILAGEFCYVLTARQMGKSSLMARTAKRLEQAGVVSAIVDLTQIGSERGDQAAAQWYFGIANLIHRQLGIVAPLRPWWQERVDLSSVQRLTDFFREVVLATVPGRVVIFVDEIDSTIGLSFADDFFAALRSCFNARAMDNVFERLTFVLLGVATPDQLIRDPARTPFNIGKRIDLTDFRPDEGKVLAPGLHSDPGEADRRLERILHWTSGHPYLTQALCRAVREKGTTGTAEEAVDPQVEELFLTSRAQREETNLKHARARLERRGPEGRRLLKLYRLVRQGKPVPDQPTSSLFAQCKLAGVVKATDDGRLAVRNRIYERVFTAEWAKAAMPADRGRQLAAATLAAAFTGVLVWYAAFQPRPYEEAFLAAIKDDGYNGALDAYTALRANPFSRSRAAELMLEFWEQRALRYALAGKRDESLLSCLRELGLRDTERLRRQAQNLVGLDYERLRFTIRYSGRVETMAFSPDGQTFATGSSDGAARIWDARTGQPIGPVLRHKGIVKAVVFSPDGRTILTGSEKVAQLWDARTRDTLKSLEHEAPVLAVAFSPDGHTLATGSEDGTARLLNAHTLKPLTHPLYYNGGPISAVALSPEGWTFATMSSLGATRLWDARTLKPLAPRLQFGNVFAVAFSRDGRMFATGSGDGIARVWNARTGKALAPPFLHSAAVLALAFSPSGQTVATGTLGGNAWLWDVHTREPLTPPLQHDTQGKFSAFNSVIAIAFSPDGQSLATGAADFIRSGDSTTRLWETRTGKPLVPTFHLDGTGYTVALSPDGLTLAATAGNTVGLWDAQSGKPLTSLSLKGHLYAGKTLAFSSDGQILATSSGRTVRFWDARTGVPLASRLQHQDAVSVVVFSPDGRTLATGSRENVRLWDARTGKSLGAPLRQGRGYYALAFSLDGRTLATGSSDSFARLWDARTGKPLGPSLQHVAEYDIPMVAVSSDGRTLATGSGGTVRFWDGRTGKPLATLSHFQDIVRTIAFNPNGKMFFVATAHWLNTYSWNNQKVVLQNSQLLHGFWEEAFRFPSDCKDCIESVLADTGNSFHLETLQLSEPIDPPIEGNPKELLEKWQARLGLKFDEQMRPVPR